MIGAARLVVQRRGRGSGARRPRRAGRARAARSRCAPRSRRRRGSGAAPRRRCAPPRGAAAPRAPGRGARARCRGSGRRSRRRPGDRSSPAPSAPASRRSSAASSLPASASAIPISRSQAGRCAQVSLGRVCVAVVLELFDAAECVGHGRGRRSAPVHLTIAEKSLRFQDIYTIWWQIACTVRDKRRYCGSARNVILRASAAAPSGLGRSSLVRWKSTWSHHAPAMRR